jgi:hypothetical protein
VPQITAFRTDSRLAYSFAEAGPQILLEGDDLGAELLGPQAL